MPSGWSIFVSLILIGCSGKPTDTADTAGVDEDGDGYTAGEGDCDDADPTRFPSADEVCNDGDDDCDGAIDEDAVDAPTWYLLEDADGDGFEGAAAALTQCEQPDGYVASYEDCDDADPAVHPWATEYCDDGVDEDCDGTESTCFTPLSSADAVYAGDTAVTYTGMSVSGAGDVNADGYDDMLIGAGDGCNDFTPCTGVSYLVLGGASPGSASLNGADATFTPEAAYDSAYVAVGAGDVNADGYDDVLIGATGNDDAGDNAGAAYLMFGGPSVASRSLSAADVEFTAPARGYWAGEVAPAGDVNADGFGDILVGAAGDYQGGRASGTAYLVFGGPDLASASLSEADASFFGEAEGDMVGGWGKLAAAGDVDGDGFDDLLLGSSANSEVGRLGAAYLVLGGQSLASGSLAHADVRFSGEAGGDFAERVAGAGDIDDDGYADLLVGAPQYVQSEPSAGMVYLVLGRADGFGGPQVSLSMADAVYTGEGDDDNAGIFVAGAGDVDADGYDDMLVGARLGYAEYYYPGAAYLVLGGSSPASRSFSAADAKFAGEGYLDYAFYVAGPGDVDADGYADLLLGAPGNNAAYLFLGGSL